MTTILARLFALAMAVAVTLAASSAAPRQVWVFFGTHTDQPGHGFSVARFDTRTGTLSTPEFLQQSSAPALYVISPDGRHIYTVNEVNTYQGWPTGFLSAYTVDPATAHMTLLNEQPSGGAGPAYISLDKTSHYVFVANYAGSSIAAFALKPDGSIGERTAFFQHTGTGFNPARQKAPHPHSIRVDPTNHFVLVPDLGLDKIFVYRFDAKDGSLTPNDPPSVSVTPGAGPRHFDFDPTGRFVYVMTEMANAVAVFTWDSSRGTLTEVQTISSLPEGFTGKNTAAEIRVHPSGRFLYCTNRGDDSIAVFKVNPADGRLTFVERVPTQGKLPRNFDFDPTGHWLLVANYDSNNVVLFKIDLHTGKLTQHGVPVSTPDPFAVRFLPIVPAKH